MRPCQNVDTQKFKTHDTVRWDSDDMHNQGGEQSSFMDSSMESNEIEDSMLVQPSEPQATGSNQVGYDKMSLRTYKSVD